MITTISCGLAVACGVDVADEVSADDGCVDCLAQPAEADCSFGGTYVYALDLEPFSSACRDPEGVALVEAIGEGSVRLTHDVAADVVHLDASFGTFSLAIVQTERGPTYVVEPEMQGPTAGGAYYSFRILIPKPQIEAASCDVSGTIAPLIELRGGDFCSGAIDLHLAKR